MGTNLGTMGTELGTEKVDNNIFSKKLVGLERFELSSIAPEATSLDQASRQPLQAGYTILFAISLNNVGTDFKL